MPQSWRLIATLFSIFLVFALLYFLTATRDYLTIWPHEHSPTSSLVSALIVGDFVCSLLPFALSIVYHTFMPHHSGEKTYVQLLKLDVFGVWWCCTLGPISNIFTGFYCAHGLMTAYVCLYFSLSLYVLYYLMVEDCKRKRTVALTVQFFVRLLIHPMRLSSLSISSPASIRYYFMMDLVSAAGAVINALHVPERWFPGKLDYVLNGHTLMHVAALVSLALARQGFLCDMTWLSGAGGCPVNGSDAGTATGTGSVTGFLGTGSPLWEALPSFPLAQLLSEKLHWSGNVAPLNHIII